MLPVIGALPGFSQLEFRSREGFEWEEVRDAAVVKCGDKKYFKREDLLTGLYEGVRFRISDVTARRMVKKEKKRELQTLFDGQVMCFSRFDDTKKSDGFVQVFRRELFTDTGGSRAEHKIMTENAAFNDKFNVFADDEHNAYYILTPQLIGKIMEFRMRRARRSRSSSSGKSSTPRSSGAECSSPVPRRAGGRAKGASRRRHSRPAQGRGASHRFAGMTQSARGGVNCSRASYNSAVLRSFYNSPQLKENVKKPPPRPRRRLPALDS